MAERTIGRRRWVARTDAETGALAAGAVMPRDEVRWGPIVAGLVTAITTFLLLSTLALWIGLAAFDPAAGGGTAALGNMSGWVSAAIGVLSFLIGGWVAGTAQGVPGRDAGALNGFLVFASGLMFVLVMAGLGLGSAFGALGAMFENIQNLNVPNVPQSEVISAITSGAGITFLALLIGAFAAALGGALGAPTVPDRVVTDEDRERETV